MVSAAPATLLGGLICLALLGRPLHTNAAEADELLILGGLIERLPAAETQAPGTLITNYYAQLETPLRRQARAWLRRLDRLRTPYRVAFNAGDTAELNNVVADIGMVWARLRTLHAAEFTPAAVAHIESAYAERFNFLAD